MVGMNLRTSPFSPFSESSVVSESLRSPYRGEERTGGELLEGGQSMSAVPTSNLEDELGKLLHANAVTTFMRGFHPKERATPNRRGRPKKRTEVLFGEVLRGHRAIADWFEREHGRTANSDVELFESFRAYALSLAPDQSRESNALSIGYSMKTVQNVLGQARRYFREHPEKCPFLGVDAERDADCNQGSECESR